MNETLRVTVTWNSMFIRRHTEAQQNFEDPPEIFASLPLLLLQLGNSELLVTSIYANCTRRVLTIAQKEVIVAKCFSLSENF